MRYNIFKFTDNTELAGHGIFLLSDTILSELEYRTYRCEDASRVMAYDPNLCFYLRKELIQCIDEANVVGYLNRFQMHRIDTDLYQFSAEYWPYNLTDPTHPLFILRANGLRLDADKKLLTELYAIDISYSGC